MNVNSDETWIKAASRGLIIRRRQTDTESVDNQRSVEVLENHRAAPARGFDRRGELPQIVSDQEHIRAGMSDLGSAAHRHAHMGVRERGASLMPSPIMATVRPRRISSSTRADFCSGSRPLETWRIPSFRQPRWRTLRCHR